MKRAFVNFTFIFAAPGCEGQIEPLDDFGWHAVVIDRSIRNKV